MIRAITVLNTAERFEYSFISPSSFSILSAALLASPAYLAEYTPGLPCSTFTSSPVSSAKQSHLYLSYTYIAFCSAFELRVSPVSGISSLHPISSSVTSVYGGDKRGFISLTLCLLWVAKTSCIRLNYSCLNPIKTTAQPDPELVVGFNCASITQSRVDFTLKSQ